MANKGFGAKEVNLIGVGTPTIDSPTDLHLDVSGVIQVKNKLDVEGATTLKTTLDVDGATTLNSTLGVTGATTLNSTLGVTGATTLDNTLDVDGATTLNSTLDVDGKTDIHNDLEVDNTVTALEYFGDGVNLSGIVTQITAGIGVRIQETESPGKGVVNIDAYSPIGKTIFVTQNGDDENSGLTENDSKRTIKGAAAIAFSGDTIKVYPGVYVEDNPIVLKKRVSIEGTELRNCIVTPKNLNRDLFHVNNSCHVTDLSFIGPDMIDGAAIIALQPLLGVSTDRFFDAARMIRYNLDYISKESVGFLTSGFSGFAGGHREQDAAKLIDLNIDYIASETVGFLTTGYVGSNGQPFVVVDSTGSPTNPEHCEDDIKDIIRCLSDDLKAGSNRKVIGAGLSYYNNSGALLHINTNDINGNSVKEATIAAIDHAVGIATYVLNNQSYPTAYTSLTQDTTSYSPILTPGGCNDTISIVENLAGIVTSILDDYNNLSGITTVYGVNIDSRDCVDDVKDIWQCIIHDITRGGNSRCVAAGKSYYDNDWNLIPEILKNPDEVEQTISTLEYSKDIVRAVINNSSWGGFGVGVANNVTTPVDYDNTVGILTITSNSHGLVKNDAVKIQGLEFSCPDSPPNLIYPSGEYGYIFNVHSVIDENTFEVIVGQSTLPHTYVSGGTIQKYVDFQTESGQLKDLAIQSDYLTGFNNGINGCVDVMSTIENCVGVVTSVIGLGSDSGITTSFPGNRGVGFNSIFNITNALYNNVSGNIQITSPGFSVEKGDVVELRDLEFQCQSGGFISTQRFPSGNYGYLFDVTKVSGDTFTVNVGVSTIPHYYIGNGFIVDRSVGISTAVYDNITGITTITAPGAILKVGDIVTLHDLEFSCPFYLPSGSGGPNSVVVDFTNPLNTDVNSLSVGAAYTTGGTGAGTTGGFNIGPHLAIGYGLEITPITVTLNPIDARNKDQLILRAIRGDDNNGGEIPDVASQEELRLEYSFNGTNWIGIGTIIPTAPDTSPTIQTEFLTDWILSIPQNAQSNNTWFRFIQLSNSGPTFDHFGLVSAAFTSTTPSSPTGAATTTIYPSGKLGYDFKVLDVIGTGTTFVVNTGTTDIVHIYESGGVVIPPYSPGVGPITQGPYVRNCTNFVPGSIGMKIDGFEAEPGEEDDIGVTGTMSVDSYTQYNQGGIGVSITNGAYAQLVSIFTICDDIAIFTGSGGQCDLTNSNSSFGRLGLVADGVGDANSKSIYRYTAVCDKEAEIEDDRIVIRENGPYRPYDGQTLYFGELYYSVQSIKIIDGGSGYTQPPTPIISFPTGPSGIRAESICSIEDGKVVSVDIISTGSQYQASVPTTIQFIGGGGSGAVAEPIMQPIYYTIDSATAPVSGISTVVLQQTLNNTVSVGTTVYFNRLSLQITSSHSFEWVGSGNDINIAKPALGGVVNTENEVVKLNGGQVIYTSTDQAGNFRIGDGIVINQLTGTITGRSFSQSILNTVNPLIIALSK